MYRSGVSDEPVPFMLRRLVSRQYHIGPEGAVIGCSPEADIHLPREVGLWDKHVEIKWISGVLSRTSHNSPSEGSACMSKHIHVN